MPVKAPGKLGGMMKDISEEANVWGLNKQKKADNCAGQPANEYLYFLVIRDYEKAMSDYCYAVPDFYRRITGWSTMIRCLSRIFITRLCLSDHLTTYLVCISPLTKCTI
ncbi:hypothetical protein HIX98_004316 [Salmonella enterica subsp. enterica serovar Bredeney]|nr:hypothetical protein [Salmonella enterica subsp. enterica serovar Bredeney]EHS1318696.1 hypothetical protein [Salmonella enterica subsp. enterica serovar Reading]